jgi:hypothetical protein
MPTSLNTATPRNQTSSGSSSGDDGHLPCSDDDLAIPSWLGQGAGLRAVVATACVRCATVASPRYSPRQLARREERSGRLKDGPARVGV